MRALIRRASIPLILAVMAGMAGTSGALACGDGEAPTSCDDPSPNGFASWMLGRVGRALQADKVQALADFTNGTHGFRTSDTYVFCMESDGVMSAHPSPILRGHDVRDVHDRTGNYFFRTMMQEAKPGQILTIHYLFPRPGSAVEEPKTTYYTRTGDQTCAVGVYDADVTAPKMAKPDGRVAQLRQKLAAEIPASAKADWTAFLEALNEQNEAKTAVLAEARRNLKAAAAALGPTEQTTAAAE